MENNNEYPHAYPDRSLLVGDMSRRSAIKAIAGAVGAITLESTAVATAVPADALRAFEVGEFHVDVSRKQISVRHKGAPSRSLWQSTTSQPFLAMGIGHAAFREHGNPLGSFDITDTISSRYLFSDIDTVVPVGDSSIAVHGTLAAAHSTISFRIEFNAVSENQLQFVISPEGNVADRYNRIFLNYACSADEAFFGLANSSLTSTKKATLSLLSFRSTGSAAVCRS